MRIQHNIAALNSYRQLGGNNNAVAKNLEKLSSGYKINKAGDDAAGLAISEKMRAQITGLETAQKNAQDGISLVQTAEGALTEVHSMLNRMAELATQSSNGTYDDSIDRANLQAEVDSLRDEINRISESTNFNGINLLDGSLGGAKVTSTQGDVLTTSASIGGKQIDATEATGNKFTIAAGSAPTFTGDAGDAAYVNITYQDETGATKEKAVQFTSGGADDAATSMKNLADAINSDKELRKIFTASVDDAGNFSIEGKQVGANAKSSITGIAAVADPAKVSAAAAGGTEGTNTTYDLSGLEDDEIILINGKEYKYNAAGGDGAFKDADELSALLAAQGESFKASGDAGTMAFKDAKGFDADITITKKDGTAITATAGTKHTFTMGALNMQNYGEGATREVKFEFKDAAGTGKTANIRVKVGATAEETANNMIAQLQKNADFKKAFADFDVKAGADGSINFTAKKTGAIDSANSMKQEITSIEVAKANSAATTTTFTGADTAGLDKHLNLKGQFDNLKDGDTITLGQKTYTFKEGSLGDDGATFSSIGSLIAAAEQNGVILEDINGDQSNLVAKSAAKTTFDFDGRIGADVIGGTIDFGGSKFKFVEAGTPAKVEAGIKNIEIAKNATAEEMAKALADAMNGVKTKEDPKDSTSGDVTWKSSLTEGKSGKNTIVTLEASPAGKVDVPKAKLTGFGINLQVGDTNEDYQKVRVSVDSMDATSLGIDKVDITNQTGAAESIKMIKDAINAVSAQRGKLGAVQNRLEHTINNLGVTTENITAAESRIRDTDMAKEMMSYTKNNILVQSAQAMLAQANTLPQGVLQLLQ